MANKLKINTIMGTTDIIMAILTFVAPFLIIGSAFDESFNNFGTTGVEGQTSAIATFFLLCALASLIGHIVALVKSKKVSISITGHVLGIVGASIYLFFGALLSLPTMILYILGAVFTLKQKAVTN